MDALRYSIRSYSGYLSFSAVVYIPFLKITCLKQAVPKEAPLKLLSSRRKKALFDNDQQKKYSC